MPELVINFIELFSESAPWLLLGLLIAATMQWMLPMELLKSQLGGKGIGTITKAALIGAPLPLCSCGVIPAAVGLRRAGASDPATVSFLVATPETGVDSVSVSYALLGPFIAIARPICAIFSAIMTALLVKFALLRQAVVPSLSNSANATNPAKTKPCCASKHSIEKDSLVEFVAEQPKKSCCPSFENTTGNSKVSDNKTANNLWQNKIKPSLIYASGKLLSDITRWLLIGIFLAAAVKTWLPSDFLTQWGDGFIAMLAMALVGIPMYICATASTPVAAGFLAMGVSPGAVLVFMLAGPATNLSTIGMVRQEMGNSAAIAYVAGVLGSSLLCGYLLNWLVASFAINISSIAAAEHSMAASPLHSLSALLLALLMIRNWIVKSPSQSVV